jgi:CTP synthase (UTP-ammonia lyase)
MHLAIIGDYDPLFRPHVVTNEAIAHSLKSLQDELSIEWVNTDIIEDDFERLKQSCHGFWIAPGSPYKSMAGALRVIEYARVHNIPTLGTCGGFQHMIIEFARNVIGIEDAAHAEYDPYASNLVVKHLSCSLRGKTLPINITDKKSLVYQIYSADEIEESYYCNFGLNPTYQSIIDNNGFKVAGIDINNEARMLELQGHCFFIATLFVPQGNSTLEKPHRLVTAFIECILTSKRSN